MAEADRRGDDPRTGRPDRHHRRAASDRPDRENADRPGRSSDLRGAHLPRRRAGLLQLRGRRDPGDDRRARDQDERAGAGPGAARPRGPRPEVHLLRELLEIPGLPYTGPGWPPARSAWTRSPPSTRCEAQVSPRPTGSPSTRPPSESWGQPTRWRRSSSASGSRSSSSPPARAPRWGRVRLAAGRDSGGAGRRLQLRRPGAAGAATSKAASWRWACSGPSRCRSSRRSAARRTSSTSRPAMRSGAPTTSARPGRAAAGGGARAPRGRHPAGLAIS